MKEAFPAVPLHLEYGFVSVKFAMYEILYHVVWNYYLSPY